VFTVDGRVRASFGEWICRTDYGTFEVIPNGAFQFLYTPVEAVAR
jgi:hypothetical protein